MVSPCALDGVEQHRARDAAEDGVIGVSGNELAVPGDDPGIDRGAFGDGAALINEPGFAGALVERRLPRQHVGQKSDGLDVDAAPAVVRHADDRNARGGERLVALAIESGAR